ncbi:hypothetical protein M8494_30585 [Serratia ureilytica]
MARLTLIARYALGDRFDPIFERTTQANSAIALEAAISSFETKEVTDWFIVAPCDGRHDLGDHHWTIRQSPPKIK